MVAIRADAGSIKPDTGDMKPGAPTTGPTSPKPDGGGPLLPPAAPHVAAAPSQPLQTENSADPVRPETTASPMVPWHLKDPKEEFLIQRVLGTGHYGVVCAATRRATGELYAIKILDKAHPEFNDDDVRNEVEILSAVGNHQNVATLYEVYEDAEHVYLVLEACLGGELFDLIIERKHFSEADAARAAAVLLSILAHCHARGVLHRDLKPENFLLKAVVTEEGRFDPSNVRAVDFGLSVHADSLASADVVGSSYYIAPEILKGHPYSPAADAWSLGVIVFILISGYPPFWGSSDQIIYDRIQNQELDMGYEPWTTDAVSAAAADFCRRLLTKDPEKRMSVDEALAHPWLTAAAPAPAPDEAPLPPSIVERLRAFTRQNRLQCLLMTLAAHHLSDAGIGELRRTFYEMDTDKDGLIGVADISRALERMGVDAQGASLRELVEQLDVGHTHAGQVNVDEFLAAALDRKKVFTQSTVAAVFKRLDRSGEGKLSMAALSTALAECGIPVAEGTLRSMMAREGALEGAGVVSARSFQNLLVAGAEHQNRPAAAALERILSGGLYHMDDEEEDAWKSVLAPRRGLTLALPSRRTSLDIESEDGSGATPFGSVGGGDVGAPGATSLDEVLRQYALSGYRTPRRRGSLAGSLSGSPRSGTTASSPSVLGGSLRGGTAAQRLAATTAGMTSPPAAQRSAAALLASQPAPAAPAPAGGYYSEQSTPRSCPSPTMACLGFD